MNDQKYREAKMRRHLGMSEEAREEMNAQNEAYTNWRGRCRRCKQEFVGSLADLRKGCPSCQPEAISGE